MQTLVDTQQKNNKEKVYGSHRLASVVGSRDPGFAVPNWSGYTKNMYIVIELLAWLHAILHKTVMPGVRVRLSLRKEDWLKVVRAEPN